MKIFKTILTVLPLILFIFVLCGCDEEIIPVGGEKEKYEVKFIVDGVIFETQIVEAGSDVKVSSEPKKEGYKFIGWDKDLTNITSDLEINAIFEVLKYEVKFLVDGVIFETQFVEVGSDVKASSEPKKEGYKFIGWDKDLTNITSDLEINAIFEVAKYEVKFLVDGVIFETQFVEYKGEAKISSEPKKEGYKFIGWDKDFTNVTSDLEINAIFEEMVDEKEKIQSVISELEEYFNGLEYPLVNGTINLPKLNNDITIKWKSSDEKVIGLDGRVRQPYTDKKQEEVILETLLSLNGCELSAKFNITVKRGYKDLSKGINAVYNYNSSYLSEAALKTFDIVYFAFLGLRLDASGNFSNSLATKTKINGYKDKLHKEGGRALVSLVANSGDAPNNIRKVAENDESLDRLANNLLTFCKENDLDGVDIDWETPGESGGLAYTKLMKKIYEVFKTDNEEYLVTSAIGAGPWQYTKYNLVASAKYHDYINMMSYDMHIGTVSSFHNALYYKTKATANQCSIHDSVAIYNSVGIKNSQIIIGVPFYGRRMISTNGLGQSGTHDGAVTQTKINNYIKSGKYTMHFDEDCKVPYLYSESQKTFVTYENERSIMCKWQYISENKLAGMMSWQLTQDSNDKLTLAMKSGKSRYM